jgi:hypothetical protein
MQLNTTHINTIGVIDNGPSKFVVNGVQFTKLKKLRMVNTCPFVPVDSNDERSAYVTWLLHAPWPPGGEDELIEPEATAVAMLLVLTNANKLPSYVQPKLQRQIASNTFIASHETSFTFTSISSCTFCSAMRIHDVLDVAVSTICNMLLMRWLFTIDTV